jgi:predicted methyltransferase
MKNISALIGLTFVLVACSQESANENATDDARAAAEAQISTYAEAVASTSRLEGDYARDAGRKPDQVLEFFGIERGMTVLDMFAGGGYYTELVSNVVGAEGRVVTHSNKAYLTFVGEEFGLRHAEGRLANVDVLMAENNELSLTEGEFDAILLVLAYHDTYVEDVENDWPVIDRPKLLAELHKSLKADGIIGIVDHYAEAGAPGETGNTVHRIDRGLVIAEMEAAGFVVDASSDLLRATDDDYSKSVFGPELRGKTDRFVLRFRKAH